MVWSVLSRGRLGSSAVVGRVLSLPLAILPFVVLPIAALPVVLPVVRALALPADAASEREAVLQFNTASRLYRQENWRDAATVFGKFLDRFPRHADAQEARFARGYCFNRLENHKAAVEDLRLASRGRGTRWAADANFYLGRSLEALAASQKDGSNLRARLLSTAATHYGLAAALHAGALNKLPAGDLAARQRLLESYVSARSSGGAAFYRARDFGQAVTALSPLFKDARRYEGARSYSRGIYFLALAHHAAAQQQKNSKASPDLAQAMRVLLYFTAPKFERDPLWPDAAYLLARLLHGRSEWEKAIALYGRLIDRNAAQRIEAAYYRALAHYEWHSPEALQAGQRAFSAFYRKNSSHELAWRARFYAALCAFDLRDYRSAARLFAALKRDEAVDEAQRELHAQALLRHGQALLLDDPAAPEAAGQLLAAAVAALRSVVAESVVAERPASRALLGRAIYWRGVALTRDKDQSPATLGAAATTFHSVAEEFREEVPDLAEEALYKESDALFRASRHRECASAAERYRVRYPEGKGRFFLASLELSGRNAFYAPVDALPADERRRAAAYFTKAASLEAESPEAASLKRPGKARELRYYSGLARYYGGDDYMAAAATLMEIYDELTPAQRSSGQYAELVFYLADSLGQQPRRKSGRSARKTGDADGDGRARFLLAARRFEEYLQAARRAPGAPWTRHAATALVNQGLCYQWAGDAGRARQSFERYLAEHGGEATAPQVRFSLASACLELGDAKTASIQYRRAAADTNDAETRIQALSLAAAVERERGEPRSAIRLAGDAIKELEADDGPGAVGVSLRSEVYFQRAMALVDAGEKKTAVSALEGFIGDFPRSERTSRARVQLAYLHLDGRKPEAGLVAIRPLIDSRRDADDRDEALYVQAWCFSQLAAAVAGAGTARSENRSTASQARSRSIARKSEASYRQLITEHPKSSFVDDAKLELAQALFNRGEHGEAKRWFDEVMKSVDSLATPPTSPAESQRQRQLIAHSLLGLGFIAFEQKDYNAARRLFDRVADRPRAAFTAQARFHAARSWMMSRGERQAVKRFSRLVEARDSESEEYQEESLLRLGECHHRLQEYPKAIAVLERMLEEYPEGTLRHEGRFALGFALQYLDRFEAAIGAYRKVVAATSQVVAARAQYQIGECAMDQAKFRDAASEFLTVVANFDFEGEHRTWVRRSLLAAGLAYQAANDDKAAAQQWKELVERFPESDEARATRDR